MPSLPTFLKLWARVEGKLVKGSYAIHIDNKFNVERFNGRKYFVLRSNNVVGTNVVFALISVLFGGLCGLFLIFLLGMNYYKDKHRDKFE